jgi:surfeit locus 1 family protein
VTFRPLPVLTFATLLALAVLIALGAWQLQRRAEKHLLLDKIGTRMASAPAPVEILLATGDYAAYRPATALGTFVYEKQIYVYAPRNDGSPRPGNKVVVPFRLASGGTILVDRGWVPAGWIAARGEGGADPEGEIEIEGVLRPPAVPGFFTPPPDLANHVFYLRDSAAIAGAVGVTLKSMLILEATKRVGDPEPLPIEFNIPDNHLNYALTWFSLAIVLLVIYLRFHHMRGRLKFGR